MRNMGFWESFPRADHLPAFETELETVAGFHVSLSDHISRRGNALLSEVQKQWKGVEPAVRAIQTIHEKVPLVAVPPSVVSLLHEQRFTYLHPACSGFNPFHSAYYATGSPFQGKEEFLLYGNHYVDMWFAPAHLWEAAKPARLGDYDRLKKIPFLHGVSRDVLRLWWNFSSASPFELLREPDTEFSSLVSRPGLDPSYELPFENVEEYIQFCVQPVEVVFQQMDAHMAFAAVTALGLPRNNPERSVGVSRSLNQQYVSSDQRFDYLTLYETKTTSKGVIFPLQSIIKKLALREFGKDTRVFPVPLVRNKSVEGSIQDQMGLRWWWFRKLSFGGDGTAVGMHIVCDKSVTAGEGVSAVADCFAETVRRDGNPWGWNPDTLFENCFGKETPQTIELFLI